MSAQNVKFDIILVGLGAVAAKHLQALCHLATDINSITLIDPRQAAYVQCESRFGATFKKAAIPLTYAADLNAALALPQLISSGQKGTLITAITTPSNLHYPQAKAALESFAHCLIEKPVTLDLQEAKTLLELSQRQKRQVAVGHIYRYFPLVGEIKELLQSGLIGELLSGSMQIEWGHDQAYYDQAAWRGKYASDGGVLLNQTIHALDFLSFLIDSKLTNGTCYLAKLNHRMEAEDYAAAIMQDELHRPFSLVTTTAALPARHQAQFKLLGTKGDLLLGFADKKLQFAVHDAQGKSLTLKLLLQLVPKLLRNQSLAAVWQKIKNPHQAIYENLFAACHAKKQVQLRAPLACGCAALETVFMLYSAAQKIHFTAAKEAISKSAEMTTFFAEK